MNILVTGSSGFLGGYLVKALEKKHKVTGYDLKKGQDILDTKKLNRYTKNKNVVIHLAALVSSPESWEKPKEYFETNGAGTLNVVRSAIKNGVRRVLITSSAAVYGKPLTPYGASKLWAEAVAEVYKNSVEVIVLRPFNIYGRGQNPAYGYVIHNFINGILKKGEIDIFGDGNQTRDFVYINDVVSVIRHFLKGKPPMNPIDVGTGKKVKIKDLGKKVGTLLNKKFDVNHLSKREEPYNSVANTKDLVRYGINPRNFVNLEKGLEKLLDSLKKHE